MRVFKNAWFGRFARKEKISAAALLEAVERAEKGLIDADLGGGLVKKRVPLPGRGKSGGARTLVATNKTGRWIFVFGFEKNERDNIEDAELAALQNIAADLLKLDAKDLYAAVASGVLQEICHEG